MPWRTRHLSTGRFSLIAITLGVTNFLMVFDGLVVTVALPAIERGLGLSPVDGQWILTSYSILLGGMLLLGGRCGDRFGRRRVLIVGMLVFTVGLLFAGFARDMATMLVGRGLQGLGSAMAIPNTYALVSAISPEKRKNRAFAVVAVAGGGAAVLGAIVGGLVADALGWREVFFLSAPLSVAAALVAPRVLAPGRSQDRPPRLDSVAAALATCGLISLVFAITNIERAGLWSVSTVLAFGVGLVALLLYAFREWRARTPLLKPALLRLKTLRAAIAGMPGQVTSYAGTVFLGLLFFEQAKGFSAVEAGLAFAPLGVAAAIGSALANRLLSARRWALFAAGAGVLCVLGLSLLALAPVRGSYFVWYMPALVLIGFGIVGAVPLNVAAGRDVPSGDKGAAYGLFETSTHISSAIAIAVLATVAAVRTNTVRATAHSDALAAGYQLAFGVTAGVALVGAIVTIVLGLRSERATRGERLEAGAAEPHAAGGVTDL